MIGIVDYGVGNIYSVKRSFEKIGFEAELVVDPEALACYDKIILPGVGAFGDAMSKLETSGMKEAVLEEIKKGKPLVGICLGMQLLMTEGEEYGITPGLDVIPGRVVSMNPLVTDASLKIPHMGWNELKFTAAGEKSPLLKYTKEGEYV